MLTKRTMHNAVWGCVWIAAGVFLFLQPELGEGTLPPLYWRLSGALLAAVGVAVMLSVRLRAWFAHQWRGADALSLAGRGDLLARLLELVAVRRSAAEPSTPDEDTLMDLLEADIVTLSERCRRWAEVYSHGSITLIGRGPKLVVSTHGAFALIRARIAAPGVPESEVCLLAFFDESAWLWRPTGFIITAARSGEAIALLEGLLEELAERGRVP